jgi:tetratricopeptide (TPR) repeat protein
LAFLEQANRLLPGNALARNRYLRSLMPSWGGSYPEAKAFIESAKAEHLPESVVMQLEAILEDDLGGALARDGNFDAARPHFILALSLSKKVGGSFRTDFLYFSTGYLCPREPALEYCH